MNAVIQYGSIFVLILGVTLLVMWLRDWRAKRSGRGDGRGGAR